MRLFNLETELLPASTERNQQVLDFIQHGAGEIANVQTEMQVLEIAGHFLPVSINDGEILATNSYVVSPVNTYSRYGEYELAQLKFGRYFRFLPRGVGALLTAAKVDRIVQVNNWLLSTNLYPPEWQGEELPALIEYLTTLYPQHAIGFRSLNQRCNAKFITVLEQEGFLNIPSRQVYGFDARAGKNALWLKKRDCKQDAKLLAASPYDLVCGEDFQTADFQQVAELYQWLYQEKYCPLNPQFSARFLAVGQRDGWLELRGLRDAKGEIVAGLGWFSHQQIMTSPVIGYDFSVPQKAGLYRLLTQLTLQEAVRRQCFLNLSAGAAHFKRLRGGEGEIESSFVYVRHLPKKQQLAWQLLGQVLRRCCVPLMKKWQL